MVPLLSVEDCKWYEMMMESGRHLAEERSPNLSSKRQSLQDRRRVTTFKVCPSSRSQCQLNFKRLELSMLMMCHGNATLP